MFQTLDEELPCGSSLKHQRESSEQVGPPPGVEGLKVDWLQLLCGFLRHHPEVADHDSPSQFLSFKAGKSNFPFYREQNKTLYVFVNDLY